MQSIDPRVNRLSFEEANKFDETNTHWITYEVFHQEKTGKQAVHAGVVHAPNPEMALVFAKEQYGRRKKTANIWVVKSSEIFTFNPADMDMFKSTPTKLHREPGSYKVRDRISAFKEKHGTI